MLISVSILLLQQLSSAMEIPKIDGQLACSLLGERLTNVFKTKQENSFYPPDAVSVKCRQQRGDNRGPLCIVRCYASVNSREMAVTSPLAAFAVGTTFDEVDRSIQDGNKNPENDGKPFHGCLKELLTNPDELNLGLPISPYHQNNKFKIFFDDKSSSYSYALLTSSVIQAFEKDPSTFYYILADKRSADKSGLKLMPPSCRQAFKTGLLPPIHAKASTDYSASLGELSKDVLIALEQYLVSFKRTEVIERMNFGRNKVRYETLLGDLAQGTRKLVSASTNVHRDVFDLPSLLSTIAKMAQDVHNGSLANPQAKPVSLIDASKIVPQMTESRSVPNTASAIDNYLCRRMIHHPKIWLSLRNLELTLAFQKPSTEAYEAFDITEKDTSLAFFKFRMDGVARGFYGLLVWEVDPNHVPLVKSYSLI